MSCDKIKQDRRNHDHGFVDKSHDIDTDHSCNKDLRWRDWHRQEEFVILCLKQGCGSCHDTSDNSDQKGKDRHDHKIDPAKVCIDQRLADQCG